MWKTYKNEQKQTKHTRKHMRIHKNKQYHTWSTARGNYRHTRCTQKHPKSMKTQKNIPHYANTWNHMQKRAITCKNTQNRAKKYKNESKQIKTQKHTCTIARTNFGHSRYTTRPCLRGGISKAAAKRRPRASKKCSRDAQEASKRGQESPDESRPSDAQESAKPFKNPSQDVFLA